MGHAPPRRLLPDAPTEVIPRIGNRGDGLGRRTVRGFGELLVTAGLVVLLFVVYEVYVTDLISAGKQDEATSALDEQWANTVTSPEPQRRARTDLLEGEAFAKMYIPAFGADFRFSIVEGTTPKDLEIGPGHYTGTALPGGNGNFAVAGHRVGKGAPFNDLDLLASCDAVVVETWVSWFVYRVLPMADEEAGWTEGKGTSARCAGVAPLDRTLGEPYARVPGRQIVRPDQGEVIDPVPGFTGAVPAERQAKLMTMTTCHPKFSDKQRLIVHAILSATYPKKPGFVPVELTEQ